MKRHEKRWRGMGGYLLREWNNAEWRFLKEAIFLCGVLVRTNERSDLVEPPTSFTGESVRAFLIICCPDSGEAASSEALRLKPDTIVTR